MHVVEHPATMVGTKRVPPMKWTVQLDLAAKGPYAEVCGCGQHGTSFVTCEDVCRAITDNELYDEEKHLKPFLTPQSWEVCFTGP